MTFRVKALVDCMGSEDGIRVRWFKKDMVYTVSRSLGIGMLNAGKAEIATAADELFSAFAAPSLDGQLEALERVRPFPQNPATQDVLDEIAAQNRAAAEALIPHDKVYTRIEQVGDEIHYTAEDGSVYKHKRINLVFPAAESEV